MNKPRLIDANELNFVCSYDRMCMATNEKCKKCEYYVCSFEDVQNQPTAYDIDKVVEQLESLETYKQTVTMEKHPFCASEIETMSKKKAIEIVKCD